MSVEVEKRKPKPRLIVGSDIGPVEHRPLEDRLELFEDILLQTFKVDPRLWSEFKGRSVFHPTSDCVDLFGRHLAAAMGSLLAVIEERQRSDVIPFHRTYLRRKLEAVYEEFTRWGEGTDISRDRLRDMILRLIGHDDRTYNRWVKLLAEELGAVSYSREGYRVHPIMIRLRLGLKDDSQPQGGGKPSSEGETKD